jgi:hypothetical protein
MGNETQPVSSTVVRLNSTVFVRASASEEIKSAMKKLSENGFPLECLGEMRKGSC